MQDGDDNKYEREVDNPLFGYTWAGFFLCAAYGLSGRPCIFGGPCGMYYACNRTGGTQA